MGKKTGLLSVFLLGLLLLGCANATTESNTATTTGELPVLTSPTEAFFEIRTDGLRTISRNPIVPVLTDSEDRIVAIMDGTETIHALKFFRNGHSLTLLGWATMDGMGMYGYDMVENRAEIPTISWSENFEIDLDANSTYSDLEVYDSEGVLLEEYDSVNDLSSLKSGFYFITILVQHNKGNYSGQEYFSYTCLFGLQK